MEPTRRLALPRGTNARQFTKLLLSLLSHAGLKMACQAEAWQEKCPPTHCHATARQPSPPAAQVAKAGGSPRIRTEFSPVKSRDFTIKVCNPIATRRRTPLFLLLPKRMPRNTYERAGRDFASREMVRAAGNAPACSCSRSKRPYKIQNAKCRMQNVSWPPHSSLCPLHFSFRWVPSALNLISGHYFDRGGLCRHIGFNWGKWLARLKPCRKLVEHLGIAPSIVA